MKINKNLLALGFCLIIISATISTSIIYKGFIYPETDGDDDDDQLPLTPPPQPPSISNETFPDDYFVFIESVNFIKGNISTPSENLTQLKYLDDETFDIIGNDTTFEFEIIFEFDGQQISFEYSKFYDLFLYLNIKTSINPEVVYFQAYSNNTWINITEIKDSAIKIERHYLESTTKFRFFGNISNQKTIFIDRLSIVFSHYKDVLDKSHKGSRVLYHNEVGWWYGLPDFREFDEDDWTWENGQITQWARRYMDGSAETELHLELELDLDSKILFELLNLSMEIYYDYEFVYGSNKEQYLNISLWDFTLNNGQGGWVQTHNIQTEGWQTITWGEINTTNFLDENNFWRVKTFSYIYSEGTAGKTTSVYIRNIDAILKIRSSYMKPNNHKDSSVLYHAELNSYIYGRYYFNNDWSWKRGEIGQGAYQSGTVDVITILDLELELDIENENYIFENLNLSINFQWFSNNWWNTHTNLDKSVDLYLWDFTTDTWFLNYTSDIEGIRTVVFEDVNQSKFVNEYNQWRIRIYSHIYSVSYGGKATNIRVWNINSVIKSDYPEIKEINTNPPSPINISETVELTAEVIPYANPISEVSYFIENYSSDWINLINTPFTNFWKINLEGSAFENGNYSLWIDAIDSKGYSSLMYLNLEFFNARPRITIISPSYLEKITQLYNYTFNIYVNDIESDIFTIPEFRIYKNASDPIINWTAMTQIDANHFNYTIDPINFSNDFYNVQFRSEDWKGYGYNESFFLIQNLPPNITILSPNETILSKPYYREIICNITNEEAINSVQWDIVVDLKNSFDWKHLIYNPISELWEGNFNLTDYKWGNYYLVINATDDKYNSSLEIKYLEFRPLFEYYFTEIEVSKSPFTISYNPFATSDIIGNVKVYHNPIVNERTFEIIIPSEYIDANNYYLIRDNIKYTPTQLINNTHTLWNISNYKSSDTIYFNLGKPIIINDELETDDEKITFEFKIISKYTFSNVLILNEIDEYIELDLYDIKLYYLLGDEWEKVYKDEYSLEADDDDDTLNLELIMLEIRSGITQFKIELTPKEEPTNLTWLWITIGCIGGGVGVGIVLYYLIKVKGLTIIRTRKKKNVLKVR